MDTDVEQQLNHSDIVESFMDEYGGRVESAEEVFGDDSVYTAIVKVIFLHSCAGMCVCVHLLCLCLWHIHVLCNVCTQESVTFYQRKGLGELPQVLVNGVTLDSEEVTRDFHLYTLMLVPLAVGL